MLWPALALLLAAGPDLRILPRPAALHLDLGDVTAERTTRTAIITAAVALVVLEALIVRERANGHVTPTISQVMEDWGTRYGTVTWTGGVLAGHWWWTQREWPDGRTARRNAILLGGLTAGVVVWDLADHSGRNRSRSPVLLLGGVLAGRLLWGQRART
jgi:hypothetical protein